jgi:hypothetical protein
MDALILRVGGHKSFARKKHHPGLKPLGFCPGYAAPSASSSTVAHTSVELLRSPRLCFPQSLGLVPAT